MFGRTGKLAFKTRVCSGLEGLHVLLLNTASPTRLGYREAVCGFFVFIVTSCDVDSHRCSRLCVVSCMLVCLRKKRKMFVKIVCNVKTNSEGEQKSTQKKNASKLLVCSATRIYRASISDDSLSSMWVCVFFFPQVTQCWELQIELCQSFLFAYRYAL